MATNDRFYEICMKQKGCNGCPYELQCFPEKEQVQEHKGRNRWDKVHVEERDEQVYSTKRKGSKGGNKRFKDASSL